MGSIFLNLTCCYLTRHSIFITFSGIITMIKQKQKKGGISLLLFTTIYILHAVSCKAESLRDAKFSIFQIVKFENAPCVGSSRNGTCFTAAECESAGGTEDGDCADGFGQCCITILSDGATTSLNQSYIVKSGTSTIETSTYTICPCSSDVCRIRFDFTQFSLAGPFSYVGTQNGASNMMTALDGAGGAIGDCQIDTFSITGTKNSGTPIICGENTGQHVFVDSDGKACHTINLGIGTATATRSLDIMVTQYRCGEEAGGPEGCLQYHTSSTGKIRSFNFPDQANNAAVAAGVTHLSSQDYDICIRRPAGATHICYTQCTNVAGASAANMAATAQASFGVSVSPDAAAKSNAGPTLCNADYLVIPGGDTLANAATTPAPLANLNRFCGRELNPTAMVANANVVSVCTAVLPFTVGVHFDADEEHTAIANGQTANSEAAVPPGGIIGFSLCYTTLPA